MKNGMITKALGSKIRSGKATIKETGENIP